MYGSFRSGDRQRSDLSGAHLPQHLGDPPQRTTSLPLVIYKENSPTFDRVRTSLDGGGQQWDPLVQRHVLHLLRWSSSDRRRGQGVR
jgi:hypothetical protein